MNIVEERRPTEAIFTDALIRPHIPREGFYPGALWQQSVAPHPRLFLPVLDTLSPEEAKSNLYESWFRVLDSRFGDSGHLYDSPIPVKEYRHLHPLAFGTNTEQLFTDYIVPAIKKHCDATKKTQIAIDNVSYLLPLWNQEHLKPNRIVEGELAQLIRRRGALPTNIGVVFLDFPPNQQKKDSQYNVYELVAFIEKHPDVLFVIDQANLYFKEGTSNNILDDLMFTDHINNKYSSHMKMLTDANRCIVTNTSTKAMGLTGCAVAAGTEQIHKLFGHNSGKPEYFFKSEEDVYQARQSLSIEAGFLPGELNESQESSGNRKIVNSIEKHYYDAITAD